MTDSPNQYIIDHLEELRKHHKSGEHWLTFAYQKAVLSLKTVTHPITSGVEARALPGIGFSIAAKIGEIIETGKTQKLQAPPPPCKKRSRQKKETDDDDEIETAEETSHEARANAITKRPHHEVIMIEDDDDDDIIMLPPSAKREVSVILKDILT